MGSFRRFPDSIASLGVAWRLVMSHDIRFFRLGMGATLGLILAERLCIVATPYLFARLVSRLSVHPAVMIVPLGLILGYGALILCRSAFSAIQELVYQPVGQRVQALTAQEAFRHMLELPYRFHRDRQTGALTRAIERGSEASDTLLRLVLFNIAPALLDTTLTAAVILHFFGMSYACVLLGAILGYVLLAQWFVRQRVRARRKRNDANGQAQHILLDSLLNFESVRHFGNEAHEFSRYEQARRAQERASLRMTLVAGASSVSQNAMIALATIVLFLMAARDITTGRLDIASFVLIGTYLRTLYQAILSLNMVYAGWRNACVDLEHLVALMNEPRRESAAPARHDPDLPVPHGSAALVFEHVCFGYGEREILKDISFSVAPGKTVAIVGPTGAGKSTIARLVLGAYAPSAGQIRLDGVDLERYPVAQRHELIGVVPQDTQLFNDTIGYNIAYGRLDATQEQIAEAARLAQIDIFIDALPQGYETLVGERGLKLSGGERQRIALARIILRRPHLLILDEATSALDTTTEQRLITALTRVTHGQTTLAIAHRLSTIRYADLILVLEDGHIVEQGTHEILLAHEGVYFTMWQTQSPLPSGFPDETLPPLQSEQTEQQGEPHDQVSRERR